MNQTNTATAIRPQSQMESALSLLTSHLNAIAQTFDQIETRLAPVLEPERKAGDQARPNGPTEVAQPQAEFVAALMEQAERVQRWNEHYSEVLRRLAV